MKKSEYRFILYLVQTISDQDFFELRETQFRGDMPRLFKEAEKLRKSARENREDISERLARLNPQSDSIDYEIARIRSVLIVQLRMTVRRALTELVMRLHHPPLPTDISLNRGLRRIFTKYSPSEVLHVVHKMKSEAMDKHGDYSWPLKNR